jgi:hypothetical protein
MKTGFNKNSLRFAFLTLASAIATIVALAFLSNKANSAPEMSGLAYVPALLVVSLAGFLVTLTFLFLLMKESRKK